MARVKIEVEVTYWAEIEIDVSDEKIIKTLKNLNDNRLSTSSVQSRDMDDALEWITYHISDDDSYNMQIEIEQLEIDNEEIF